MWENIVLSDREKTILDIVVDKKTIAECEKELLKHGIKVNSAYKTIQNLSKRGSKAMTLVNQINGYRRTSKRHFGILDKKLRFFS